MRILKSLSYLLFLILISSTCKKAGANNSNTPTAPTNLIITANVNSGGSGAVDFTASAENAISYVFEFGNGEIKTVASGVINYQYTSSGTNNYTVTVTATSNSGLTLKKSIQVSVTVQAATGTLVFSDEFNTDGTPDASKWGYDIGTGSNGWGNSELEYYTSRPENVIVQNGVLKIKAIKENYSGSQYTSARMLSKNKFVFTYGRVEVRAKLPAGVGTWPAIWMLGSDFETNAWPACGEIDIMEHRGSELNKIFGTLHYPGHSGGSANGNTKIITNATTEFHIYKLDWTAASINIYVDDMLYHTVANSASIPFNHDFFFILNVAMGGGFAGNVDPLFTNSTMEVDYIRVYK
jgi:beta-glucanase (GH16 family)